MLKTGRKQGKLTGVDTTPEQIPPVFPAIDNDLAVENMEDHFDMTAADLQDL